MLREIDKNLWVSEQPFKYLGLSVGTRMTVVRLASDELIAISPIRVDDTTISQLNAIGRVGYIVAPNSYHYLFASSFKKIYPHAKFLAAPGLPSKKPDLPIDEVISESKNNFGDEFEYFLFDGLKTLDVDGALNEIVFFHRDSHTLILTDTVFHFDESFPFVTQLAARVLGNYQKLSPSLLEKLATKDTEKVRRSVHKVLAWDFQRVIVAHGSIVETNAKQRFQDGYAWFLGKL
jgi:hypothetical protein